MLAEGVAEISGELRLHRAKGDLHGLVERLSRGMHLRADSLQVMLLLLQSGTKVVKLGILCLELVAGFRHSAMNVDVLGLDLSHVSLKLVQTLILLGSQLLVVLELIANVLLHLVLD